MPPQSHSSDNIEPQAVSTTKNSPSLARESLSSELGFIKPRPEDELHHSEYEKDFQLAPYSPDNVRSVSKQTESSKRLREQLSHLNVSKERLLESRPPGKLDNQSDMSSIEEDIDRAQTKQSLMDRINIQELLNPFDPTDNQQSDDQSGFPIVSYYEHFDAVSLEDDTDASRMRGACGGYLASGITMAYETTKSLYSTVYSGVANLGSCWSGLKPPTQPSNTLNRPLVHNDAL